MSFSTSIYLAEQQFDTSAVFSTTKWWTHLVLNYIGPDNRKGIRLYLEVMTQKKLQLTQLEMAPWLLVDSTQMMMIYMEVSCWMNSCSSMNLSLSPR